MNIPYGFDEANKHARKRHENIAMQTAQRLNYRIRVFLRDVEKNASISESKKKQIKTKLLQDL